MEPPENSSIAIPEEFSRSSAVTEQCAVDAADFSGGGFHHRRNRRDFRSRAANRTA